MLRSRGLSTRSISFSVSQLCGIGREAGARTSSAFPEWTRSDRFATLPQFTATREAPEPQHTRHCETNLCRLYTEEGFAAYNRNDIRWTWRQGQNLQSVTYPSSVAHSYSYDTRNRLTSLGVAR